MSIEVKIPPMGESISSGVLAKWHVQNGDVVQKDQALFELETDKITSEGTAEATGKITFKVEAGTEVKIGQVVALIDEATVSSAKSTSAPAGGAECAPIENQKSKIENPAMQSPAVRRLAAETGIEPATVTGTGKAGRVTKGDMLAAAEAKPVATSTSESKSPAPSVVAATTEPVAPGERQTRTKMSKLRQTIATRLVQAQHQAAMLTTFNECDMSAVMELRKKYQDDFMKRHGVKLGFMSFFTKAVVHALKEVPAVNAFIEGDSIVQNNYYDIGVAVSTERGLMVPVIRDCDTRGMADIEKAIAAAAQKARDGKITLPDLEGGVFTITNGGIFGSMLSTPILNAPQSAILGLHSIQERPVAVSGQVVVRPMMYLALSYDHRLVDGREAVTFLVKVKQVIEDPARLLIGA
jgi:2-oxoglutarate dehydrogenase E2 component (dihydrolipoamide succinyltransferase)